MENRFSYLCLAVLLIFLNIAIRIVAAKYPEEIAFVFCSTVYAQYVELWLNIYQLTEQFHPVWPWQR